MPKKVPTQEINTFLGRVSTGIDWSSVDYHAFMNKVKGLPQDEFSRLLTAFINNGFQFQINAPGVLGINRFELFNPATFINSGWSIDNQDERSLTLTKIDFSSIRFVSGLTESETNISGHEKLTRLTQSGLIRLDAKVAQTLYEERGQTMLRFIYQTFNVSWMEFAGTELIGDDGKNYLLTLFTNDGIAWRYRYRCLGYGREGKNVSPLLVSL